MKKKILILFFLVIGLTTVFVAEVYAQTPGSTKSTVFSRLYGTGNKSGFSGGSDKDLLVELIGGVISAALGFLGLAFLILVIYAGWLWFKAGDNEDDTKKAMVILRQGVIGLIIISLAYAITALVMRTIVESLGL